MSFHNLLASFFKVAFRGLSVYDFEEGIFIVAVAILRQNLRSMIFIDFMALHPGLLVIFAEEVLEILLNKAFF